MKQITIYELLPLLRKGWVAMDRSGEWWWFSRKPRRVGSYDWEDEKYWQCYKQNCEKSFLNAFNIAPFDGSWKDSLIKVGHKEEGSWLMVDKSTGPEWYKNGKRIK